MSLQQLLGQLDMSGAAQWFIDVFKPDNPISIVILAAIAIGGYILARLYVQTKEPDGKRIDSFIITMPSLGVLAQVMAYEYPDGKAKPNLEMLRELPNAGRLADDLIKIADDLHYYIVKYESTKTAVLKGGMALLLMHRRIDDPALSERMWSTTDIFRGKIHTRLLAQASDKAAVITNAVQYGDESIDLIYYPEMPPSPDSEVKALSNPHATLAIAAQMREYVAIQKQSKLNEIARRAAEKGRLEAISEIKRLQEKVNLLERMLGKRSYWGREALAAADGMSMWITVGVVGGCAIILPDLLQRYLYGYTPQHYIGMAVLIGAMLCYAVSWYMNRNNRPGQAS